MPPFSVVAVEDQHTRHKMNEAQKREGMGNGRRA